MLFHLIIKGLSATADGFGRGSADRFAAKNNRNGIQRNSVSWGTEEYALWLRVAGVLPKQPEQICPCKVSAELCVQFCRRENPSCEFSAAFDF